MRVTLLLFGPVREMVGQERIALELSAAADVSQLAAALTTKHPTLRAGASTLRFAIDSAFVDGRHVLADGDEIAVIPPVSGG